MFGPKHPEAELIAYLQGELAPRDQQRVLDHLATCAACTKAALDFQTILRDLRHSVPGPPEIHWGAYRAELREKLRARRAPASGWQWLRRPVPLALSAAAAGLLLFFVFQSGTYPPAVTGDLALLEQVPVVSRLDLLRQYSMLERLDLWEDLDVVRHLEQLSPSREG